MPAASAAPRHAASIPAKNRFHHLLPHFSFQRSDAILIAAISARSGKRLGAKLAQLAPPAVQNVRVYLAGTGHLGHRCPQLQPPNCGFLKLPRELPSIQTHDTILHSLRDVSYSPVSISGSTPNPSASTIRIRHLHSPSKSSLVHFGPNLSRDLRSSSLVPPQTLR